MLNSEFARRGCPHIHIANKKIPVLCLDFSWKYLNWKFWKYKVADQNKLYDFLISSEYVFWITCCGHKVATRNYLPIDYLDSQKQNVWITICYSEDLEFYKIKYFKMNKKNFINFYIRFFRLLNYNKKTQYKSLWKNFGF